MWKRLQGWSAYTKYDSTYTGIKPAGVRKKLLWRYPAAPASVCVNWKELVNVFYSQSVPGIIELGVSTILYICKLLAELTELNAIRAAFGRSSYLLVCISRDTLVRVSHHAPHHSKHRIRVDCCLVVFRCYSPARCGGLISEETLGWACCDCAVISSLLKKRLKWSCTGMERAAVEMWYTALVVETKLLSYVYFSPLLLFT